MITESVFRVPEQGDAEQIRKFAVTCGARENDLSFVNMYLLQKKHGISFAFVKGVLLRHFSAGAHKGTFSLSFGEDVTDGEIRSAVAILEEEAGQRGELPALSRITDFVREKLDILYPGRWVFRGNRDYAEYFYRRDILATMAGRKLGSKRNHVAQFVRACPDAKTVPITPENIDAAAAVARQWLAGRKTAERYEFEQEYNVIQKGLREWNFLQLKGILLMVGGSPIGMAAASEISSGVWDEHFEKVVPGYAHAGPVLVQKLAKYLEDAVYINREEDVGDPGLRQAKLSYQPEFLNRKYDAVPEFCSGNFCL